MLYVSIITKPNTNRNRAQQAQEIIKYMKAIFPYILLLSVVITSCNSLGIGGLAANQELVPVRQEAAQGTNWMKSIPGERKLSTLSIPGTHGSGGRFEPLLGTAKTQNLSIAEQLNAGVRFLDVRCRFINNSFVIHHDRVYQHLNFDDVLQSCALFLDANPSEAIIMSIKEEYTPSGNTMTFQQRFINYAETYAGLFRLDTDVPTLQDARGKIVLLRRFESNQSLGIQAFNGWLDNASFTIQNPESTLQVQDAYKVSNNAAKWDAITTLLNTSRNAAPSNSVLFLNFSSGYQNRLLPILPDIRSVSNDINPRLINFFNQNSSGTFGVIITDLIYPDLAKRIYDSNF